MAANVRLLGVPAGQVRLRDVAMGYLKPTFYAAIAMGIGLVAAQWRSVAPTPCLQVAVTTALGCSRHVVRGWAAEPKV